MSKKKDRKTEWHRRTWNDELNFFKADKNSKWKYEPFKNKPAKEIHVARITWLLVKGEIVKKNMTPKEVFGKKDGERYSRGTRMHRTYVYRSAVAHKIYDAHSAINKKGQKPKTPGNWGPIDRAIDKWNQEFGGFIGKIENGKLKQAKSGRKETTPDNLLEELRRRMKEASKNKKAEQVELPTDKKK